MRTASGRYGYACAWSHHLIAWNVVRTRHKHNFLRQRECDDGETNHWTSKNCWHTFHKCAAEFSDECAYACLNGISERSDSGKWSIWNPFDRCAWSDGDAKCNCWKMSVHTLRTLSASSLCQSHMVSQSMWHLSFWAIVFSFSSLFHNWVLHPLRNSIQPYISLLYRPHRYWIERLRWNWYQYTSNGLRPLPASSWRRFGKLQSTLDPSLRISVWTRETAPIALGIRCIVSLADCRICWSKLISKDRTSMSLCF